MTTTSLSSLLREMQTWITISPATLEAAELSGITTKNSEDLRYYLKAWVGGRYDEDPQSLVDSLIYLIPKKYLG